MAADKLSISSEMRALDSKNRDFYDGLTDDEKKKFSTFLMIRYGASVSGIPELQQYYLQATNQRLNKNFFSINKTRHDKLNWLASTTISPGMGTQNHIWIKGPSQEKANSKAYKFLSQIYPHMKLSDIKLLLSLNSMDTLRELAKDLGMSREQIKSSLG